MDREWIACKLCEANNGSGCTQMYSPDPKNWICKAWLNKAAKQYTHQPEPLANKVEVVKDLYCKWCPREQECDEHLTLEEKRACLACGGFTDEILKLCQPELTKKPVIDDKKTLIDEPKTPLELARRILEIAWHGDYSNGNTAPSGAPGQGIDEGQVMASEVLKQYQIRLDEFTYAHDQDTLTGGN